ncbi:MAG TPA: biotin/lipoyl-binding protein, partial [Phaeodactylibacter sp.]|nr:biotin/lipoyl-binding protein [Phaeodactylibacter sp.]
MKTKIATLLLLPFFFASCSEEEGYTVQRKKLVQAVYSSGEVLPAGYYEATSKIPGIVDTVYVRVGQEVKAGTPLLRLQSQAERLNVQTAKNLYALARENAAEDAELLSSLQQKVETAYEAYKWDSLDYERYKRLRAQDIGTQQTYEQAELRYQTAKRNYTIAQNNLQETRMRLQTELKNAKNNYLAQQSRLADHTIVAEADGKVYDILPKPGELVSSSTPIIYLGAADAFEVEMRVDET